jgi:hypothetical protein
MDDVGRKAFLPFSGIKGAGVVAVKRDQGRLHAYPCQVLGVKCNTGYRCMGRLSALLGSGWIREYRIVPGTGTHPQAGCHHEDAIVSEETHAQFSFSFKNNKKRR